MDSGQQMNYLALNQNIMNMPLVIGQGLQEGTSETPISTLEGLQVYLNGTHVIPECHELIGEFGIGEMVHPYAMDGMPGCTGNLRYAFCWSEHEYMILVGLKLDESTNGPSEEALDILAVVKRDEHTDKVAAKADHYELIIRDMLLCHFDSLFEFYDTIEEVDDWTFYEDDLLPIVKYHFELKKAVDFIGKELEK